MDPGRCPTSHRSPTVAPMTRQRWPNVLRRPMVVGIVVVPMTTEFSSTADPVPTSTPVPRTDDGAFSEQRCLTRSAAPAPPRSGRSAATRLPRRGVHSLVRRSCRFLGVFPARGWQRWRPEGLIRSCAGEREDIVADKELVDRWLGVAPSSSRTRGMTWVPYSSMLVMRASWERPPMPYLRSKRWPRGRGGWRRSCGRPSRASRRRAPRRGPSRGGTTPWWARRTRGSC